MAFNATIPVITDPILQSSRQIRANFQAIAETYANNHISLTKGGDFAGKHRVLVLRAQGSDPATSATQVALYNKLVTSIPQVFYRANNSQTAIQLTYQSVKIDGTAAQYTFIAGPFIVYGGYIPAPTQGQTVALTPGSQLIHVDLTVTNAELVPTILPDAIAVNIVGTSFDIQYQTHGIAESLDVYYFAIGLP